MAQKVRLGDETAEKVRRASAILDLSPSDVVEASIWTDLLTESPKQNARRAVQNYYTFILEEYEDPTAVPVADVGFQRPEQVQTALTIGQEKRENWVDSEYDTEPIFG